MDELNDENENIYSDKNKYIIFALSFPLNPLAYLGFHRFYCGKIMTGILQFLTAGGLYIWAWIDFSLILMGKFKDSEGKSVESVFGNSGNNENIRNENSSNIKSENKEDIRDVDNDQVTEDEGLIKVAHGQTGKLKLFENRLVICRSDYDPPNISLLQKVLNFVLQGLKGNKTIPIDKVTSLQFKESGVTTGYLQVSLQGSDENKGGVLDAQEDENTITFHDDQETEFIQIKKEIEKLIYS